MKKACLFLVGLASVMLPLSASAGLVVSTASGSTGFGFGNVNRDLTIQEVGPDQDGIESGCVGLPGGVFTVGPGGCLPDETGVFQPNGFVNDGGDEPPPHGDNHKYGAPTIGSLGITNAGEINIIFDATEPGGDGLVILDLTLKFYDGDTLIMAIDGSATFTETFEGNGVADYIFVIDEAQQEEVNNVVFSDVAFPNFRMALESTILDVDGGPESFVIVKGRGGPPIPEPPVIALMGVGLLGFAVARRRRS